MNVNLDLESLQELCRYNGCTPQQLLQFMQGQHRTTPAAAATQQQLNRGARLTELLKQGQYSPFDVIDQCISIYAGSKGFLDNLPLDKVHDFESDMLDHFRGPGKSLRDKLVEERSFKKLGDEFETAIGEFKKVWTS